VVSTNSSQGTRRLAAIMFTDMVGYTALGQRNEELSLALVEEQRKLVRPILARHDGREVKTIGDAFLVVFANALDAVRCAYDIQRAAREFNYSLPDDRKVHLRVGVHLGDIVESQGDISGDAVNVASRIEQLAEDGGVCLTRQVYDHVQNKFELPFASLGARTLKNVVAPMEIFRMVMPWEDTVPRSGAQPESRRIAVLPLANLSPDRTDEYFADGMTDELISMLSKIGGLRVVARTSAMRFKGEKVSVGQIRAELNVGYLVEGSVRKSNERVRISIQLVDTKTDEQLWGDSYDRDLYDVFAVQTEIAHEVARALEVKLGAGEGTETQSINTRSPEAHTLYLKGRYHWNTRAESGVNRAIKYFEEATARDPRYALAFVGLADCYSILGYYGYRRPAIAYPMAKELAEKALSLDAGLAEAHASLGETLMQYYLDWRKARLELDRALELNPSYAMAHMWRATHHIAHGRVAESLADIERAVELDPLSMIILSDAARDLFLARRYDESIEQYKRSLQVDPNFPIAHKGLAEVYVRKGMYSQAIVEIEKAIELSGRSVFILDDLGYVYASAGMRDRAEGVLKDLDELAKEEYVPSYGRAAIYAGLRDADKTLDWLERAFEERSFLVYVKVDPVFDFLKTESKFIGLLNRIGL